MTAPFGADGPADGNGPAGPGGPEARAGADGGDAEVHAWERTFAPWDCYFAIAWIATVLFALAAETPGWPVRLVAAGLFALLVPWYVVAGRPAILIGVNDSPAALRYVAVLVTVFVVASALVGELRLGTFALVPQCFMLLRVRTALATVAVINVIPVVGWVVLWRPDRHDVYYNSVFAVVTLGFSMVVGSWIMRVIEQSAERADTLAELRASREEVARLSAERGALAERERMSREIHDTLAQGFTSLLMLVQAVESEFADDPQAARAHLALMARTARENLAEARALVAGGGPADLAGGSLPDAVRRVAARHRDQAGGSPAGAKEPATVTVEVTGRVRALPAAVEVVALRTCQEALANVRRHAGQGVPAYVRLAYGDEELTVTVRDEGRGLGKAAEEGADPGGARAASGFGLRGLRARAAELGGAAHISGEPGSGTTVTVVLPVGDVR
ncbi:sensor histidine kinase [Actinacidiphila acidipaludis]|uniref:sensor histidine kinase n=1 Tax=Actinacidiphila acidipaludis TaxID=2873382 RepID=UPI0027DFCB35|nr:sensor histidine kinase [Streptomyces acidipaludis]